MFLTKFNLCNSYSQTRGYFYNLIGCLGISTKFEDKHIPNATQFTLTERLVDERGKSMLVD